MPNLGLVQILAIVGGLTILLAAFYVFQVATRTKEMLAFRAKLMAASVLLYLVGIPVLRSVGFTPWQSLFVSFLVGLMPRIFMRPPRRSRHIPAGLRREVEARDSKGQGVDRQKNQTHHVVPFTRGGDHSLKNLRVVPTSYNLSQGARMPGLLNFLGWWPKLDLPRKEPTFALTQRLVRVAIVVVFTAILWRLWRPVKQHSSAVAVTALSAGIEEVRGVTQPNEGVVRQTLQSSKPASPAEAQIANEPIQAEEPLITQPSTANVESASESAPVEHLRTGSDNTLAYSAGEVFAMYKASKREADKTLKGNTVEITGLVRRLGKGEVSLRDPKDTDSVQCNFDISDTGRFQAVFLGKRIMVRGRVRGRTLMGNVQLDGCELIESDLQ